MRKIGSVFSHLTLSPAEIRTCQLHGSQKVKSEHET